MTKTFCDNCEAETDDGFDYTDSGVIETRLHPSNIVIKINVKASTFESKHVCMNCWLTALHGAFKQPEAKP